jgi:trimethylamine:corrinoid methyltransferase-like protein
LAGGQYKPLSDANVLRIHEAALDALEQIGLSQAPPSGVAILTGAGAIQGDDGRIRFPRALVEDMLAVAARDITLFGRDPLHDLIFPAPRCISERQARRCISSMSRRTTTANPPRATSTTRRS